MTDTLARRAGTARTFLFVPGTRPERFDKGVASGADLVILDLEDAVSIGEKEGARRNVVGWLRAGNVAAVRINSVGSPEFAADVAALEELDCVVVLPKSESASVLGTLADSNPVIALVETARGVMSAAELSAVPGVVRTALGHIDLAAELGIDPDERAGFIFARSALVLAAASAGIDPPVDGVTPNFRDPDVLRSDVAYGKSLGLSGKLCIHPAQIHITHETLGPSAADIAWAQKITASISMSGGVASVDGHMVDPPVLARAVRILAAATK